MFLYTISILLQCLIGVVVWMRLVWVTKMVNVLLPLVLTFLYHLLLGNLVYNYLLKCHLHLLFIKRHRRVIRWCVVVRGGMLKQHQPFRECPKYQLLKGSVCKHLGHNYGRCLVSDYLLLCWNVCACNTYDISTSGSYYARSYASSCAYPCLRF